MVRRGGLGEPEAWIEGGEGGATDPRDVRVVNNRDDHRMAETAWITKRCVSPCAVDWNVLGRPLDDRVEVSRVTRGVLGQSRRSNKNKTPGSGAEPGGGGKDEYDGGERASCPGLTAATGIRRIRRRRRIRCERTTDDKPGRRHRQGKRIGAMRTSPLLRVNNLERIGRRMG